MSLRDIIDADLGLASHQLGLNQFDQGLLILEKYPRLWLTDLPTALLRGKLLLGRGDLPAAEETLRRVLELQPGNWEAIMLLSRCLCAQDDRPAAMRFLTESRSRHPDNPAILSEILRMALIDEGLSKTIALLEAELSIRKPGELEEIIDAVREKAMSLFSVEEIEAADPRDLLAIGDSKKQSNRHPLASIYSQFEPLGFNCEFGFVQRKRGAEPLSIFRWTLVFPTELIRLLDNRLSDLEQPSNYALEGTNEYLLFDKKYHTRTHTGVSPTDMPAAEFAERAVRRQGFLKRKFLADAADDRKIFLYKAEQALSADYIVTLQASLGTLGASRLLVVLPDPARAMDRPVEKMSENLMIGYLSTVMPRINFDEWDKIVIRCYEDMLGSVHV